MNNTFLIIDDDINIRKMLNFLIKQNSLGNVLDEISDGESAVDDILFYNPDIVLIDLLLPVKDGIEILSESISKGYKGKFIMISQVESTDMISKAYESGILFFLNKPINSIETTSVIKQVCKSIELEKSVELIKNTLLNTNSASSHSQSFNFDTEISTIFNKLGINSERGSSDLKKLILKIMNIKTNNPSSTYQLQKIYEEISNSYHGDVNSKTIEQRIRRVISKALTNLAELGIEDFYNPVFSEFNSILFDFKQIRIEMNYINGKSKDRGKINIRKFADSIADKFIF